MGEAMVGMLEGKSALITGGGGGIGRAAALAFADLIGEAAEETVALDNPAGGQAISLAGGITNGGLVQEMIGFVVAAYGVWIVPSTMGYHALAG